jgi:catechol 2,3-dioxygenase-like lactoylglutathione lyase family enzyme
MELKLGHTEIFVKDPLKSREFYTEILGFEHIETQDDKFVWLSLGGREILLRPGDYSPNSGTYQSANMALVIYTDDAEEALRLYKEKGLEIKGDDTGCPVFTDPDGNWFQLVNPGKH